MALRVFMTKNTMVPCFHLRNLLFIKSDNWTSNHRGGYTILEVNKTTKPEDISQSTILFEEGTDIQELPVIIRKVHSENSLSFYDNILNNDNKPTNSKSSLYDGFPLVNDKETIEIIEGFNRCYTSRGIFALLETMPSNEVTPYVALQALQKIITLENNKQFRNQMSKYNEDLHPNETFTRTAILNQLVEKIASSSDPTIVLYGLKIVSRDMLGTDSNIYKNKLCIEVLCRVTDSKFDIEQTCEAVKIFFTLGKGSSNNTDKLWVGISQKSEEINENNLMEVFRCLPYFKKSRKLILNTAEKKLIEFWFQMSGNDVSEILSILREIKSFSPRILEVLSRWTDTNIHTVSEDNLLEIINGFWLLDYTSTGIESALERYVKAKGIRVKNPILLSKIMDYCLKFQFRSVHLLQGSAEYIITHGKELSPILLKSLFSPLGYLNYNPQNSSIFWQVLEESFEQKFIQFRPEDAIDMLLTCVYLQKYPLNFVKKVFNPYFLDRLHSTRNIETLKSVRSKLKMLDSAMTLECEQYKGPLLPKDHSAKSFWQDGRSKRILNNIRSTLTMAANGEDRVSYNVVLPFLPTNELYIIDALLHPSGFSSALFQMNVIKNRDLYVAVLVHLPEHFCSNKSELTGPQAMRIRHFRKLGFKVATLNYDELSRLRVHPVELKHYVEGRFQNAYLSY
uniref:RAP domain-containing protein n=1 Tax=Clastoptera arizonana TaxID=38151 RepID=A0A1B6D3C2_9HEMI